MPVLENLSELDDTGPLLGIDPGKRRIGVAASDPDRRVATAITTIQHRRLDDTLEQIRRLAEARGASAAIVGLPLEMSGRVGSAAQSARSFARHVSDRLGFAVVLWDERLSTVAVTRSLRDLDISKKRKPEVVDASAAAYILQGALNRLNQWHHD